MIYSAPTCVRVCAWAVWVMCVCVCLCLCVWVRMLCGCACGCVSVRVCVSGAREPTSSLENMLHAAEKGGRGGDWGALGFVI